MDKLTSKQDSDREKRNGGFFRGIIDTERRRREENRGSLVFDLAVIALGLLFSRCHVVFGAHPLGIALISVLPAYVWAAAIGSVVGALTLGTGGLIYAIVSAITLFLRVIISGGGKREQDSLFGENLLLRMSAAVIGGFVASVYELLLSGFGQTSILYGISMILLPPLLTFAFSGLFGSGIGLEELLHSKKEIFSLSGTDDGEKMNKIFFQGSALMLLFFTALSLGELEVFGISASYIFVSFATLLVSRRFGALRGLATGFLSSLGVSGVYSVSFALAGLLSGLLFEFGIGYGLLGGVMALSAWSAYSSGLSGFLATLPEYLMAAALATPLLRGLPVSKKEEVTRAVKESATEMVGTMALAYKNRYVGALDGLEVSLVSLASVIRNHGPASAELGKEDYAAIIRRVSEDSCKSCGERGLCESEEIRPCALRAERLADILASGGRLSAEQINTDTEFCAKAHMIAEEINSAASAAERERYLRLEADGTAEEYELIANLISEARSKDDAERAQNSTLSEAASEITERYGPGESSVRVFGERRHHVILAGEDADGTRITSGQLKSELENMLKTKLTTPEFFRRDTVALMECDSARSYAVEYATATAAGDSSEVSGDTVCTFETADHRFYALVSDGMGRGEAARSASEFVAKFLTRALDFGATKETVLHLLNYSMRRGREECSATVDLFELDLIRGDAMFLKSGAAISYVKRDSSIFRIRSETAPIGLMRTIDTERVRVEIKPEDYVIMISDGISQSGEDVTWLLELLSKPVRRPLSELAELILAEAKARSKNGDDMSVIALKIVKI